MVILKLILISLAIFITTILLIEQAIDLITSGERKTKNRLTQTLGHNKVEEQHQSPVLRSQKKGELSRINPWLQRMADAEILQQERVLLEQSGIPLKFEEYLGICLLSGFILLLISIAAFKNIFLVFIMAVLGSFLPCLWARSVKRKRVARMEGQLLNAVVLLANSLRAGHSFMQALDLVSHETSAPLGEEFERIIRETRMGVRIEESLGKFSERMDSREIELLVTGILVQREVGGNLAEILDIIANTIDKRIKMRKKIRVLTSQGRLSGWIVSLLPVALIFLIYIPHPEYAQVMLTETLGRVMLGAGFLMIIIGSMIIKKVVNIDV